MVANKRLIARILLGGAVVLAGAAVLAHAGSPSHAAAGTRVAGIAVGGLDADGIRGRLQSALVARPKLVTVTAGARSFVLPRENFGTAVNINATVDRTLRESGRRRMLGMLDVGSGRDVQPILDVDADRLDEVVRLVVRRADLADFHGDLSWDGKRFRAEGPVDGQFAEASAVRTELRKAAADLTHSTVSVPITVAKAHGTVEQLRSLAELASRSRHDLVLTAAAIPASRRSARLPAARLAPLVTVQEGVNGHLELGLRRKPVEPVLNVLASELSLAPREPTINTPPPVPLLSAQGDTVFASRRVAVDVASGRPGQGVSATAVHAALTSALNSASPRVSVAATLRQPTVSPAEAGRVNALIGTFTTEYACCQPRAHNIGLIARAVNGTVIAPGRQFSLNGIVGERTEDKGYVEAPFISDGKLELDIGGGVSQFATTAYNAAFFAGLELDIHKAHSFYIRRYPAGREATVNFPSIDLRWTNDTKAPVVVRATTTPTSITVSLFGNNGGRTVQAITGERKPVGGKDFRITVRRLVRGPGPALRTENIITTYAKPPQDE